MRFGKSLSYCLLAILRNITPYLACITMRYIIDYRFDAVVPRTEVSGPQGIGYYARNAVFR